MTNNSLNSPGGMLAGILFGGIFFLAGSLVVLVAADIIHSDPSSIHAPRWVLAAFGGVFVLVGILVAMQASFGPGGQQTLLYQWLQLFLGLALMTLFSSVFLWVGFGPGEREFSTTTTIGPISTSGTGGEGTGRFIFGGAGVLMVFFTIAMAVSQLRKIFKGK